VHVSTDYVFDGTKVPYAEGDVPHPLNYYGRTKLASENALKTSGVPHTIIRTSLMYGSSESLDTNEALIIAQKLERKETIELATDLCASPTLVNDVALALVRATERSKFGVYHVAAHEMLSRYEFGLRVAQAFGLDTSLITGKLNAEIVYPVARAERPMKSALVSLKAQTDLGLRLSNVDEGLQVTVRGIQEISGEDFDQHIYE
jgi:dTDP-4-dehydrorhamnose reductase